MKILLLGLMFLTYSCKETYYGNLKAYESIKLGNGDSIQPGDYDLKIKAKKKKIILELDDKKLKLKLKRKIPKRGEFKIQSKDLDLPYEVSGEIFTEVGQPVRTNTTRHCSIAVPVRVWRNVCTRGRNGRRICRRALRTTFRYISGIENVTIVRQERTIVIDADLISEESGRAVARFEADRIDDVDYIESSSGCRRNGGFGLYRY